MRGAIALALAPFLLTAGPVGATTPKAPASAEGEPPAGGSVVEDARKARAIDYECICCDTHKKRRTGHRNPGGR